MNDAQGAVLCLRDVRKAYRSADLAPLEVLRGVDFRLMPGEVVGLLAPSGAGKSTLLHVSGLLDQPDHGQIDIAGQPMTNASDRQRTAMRRRTLGFVYQFHHLLPEFTALENIVLPQLADGRARAAAVSRAAALLDRVGLAQRATHRPARLSGGEQQRVAFCRALANQPKILLADEPTGNLDPATAGRIFDLLLEMVRETGLSALIATHNPDLAARMDRRVRLHEGRLVPA
jgi:lipoprotein-releasing system ATP-binding protein